MTLWTNVMFYGHKGGTHFRRNKYILSLKTHIDQYKPGYQNLL